MRVGWCWVSTRQAAVAPTAWQHHPLARSLAARARSLLLTFNDTWARYTLCTTYHQKISTAVSI